MSWLAFLLARAGYSPVVFDNDTIESHNTGGQLFRVSDVGKLKVEALSEIIEEFSGSEISTFTQKYEKGSTVHQYTFSAFDNMKARKDMFENWKELVKDWEKLQDLSLKDDPDYKPTNIPIFIDGRLLMEAMQIFCVTPDKIEEYEKHLFEDSEVEDEPCTLKQTSHSAAMIASHMVGFFTNHMTNVYEKSKDRNIPFYWEYFIPINYIKEE